MHQICLERKKKEEARIIKLWFQIIGKFTDKATALWPCFVLKLKKLTRSKADNTALLKSVATLRVGSLDVVADSGK